MRSRSPRRARLVHFAYSMQSREWPAPPRRRDDRRAARPRIGDRRRWAPPSPRGDAARRPRPSACAPPPAALMASAMAAVVPPYSGGKVYATRQGAFTFVIVLFDVEGRLAVHARRRHDHPPPHAGRVRARDPRPGRAGQHARGADRDRPSGLDPPRDARRELPGLTQLAVCGAARRRRSPSLVDRARAAGIPAVAAPTSASDAVDGADVVVTVTREQRAAVPGATRSATAHCCARSAPPSTTAASSAPTSSRDARRWCATTSPAAGRVRRPDPRRRRAARSTGSGRSSSATCSPATSTFPAPATPRCCSRRRASPSKMSPSPRSPTSATAPAHRRHPPHHATASH